MFKKDEDNSVIEFSYTISEIFESASQKSAFNAKNVRDKEGRSLVDQFAITTDEKGVFVQGLRSVLPDIFSIILKITTGLDKAYDLDEDKVYFTINDNMGYNENALSLVDDSIKECLVEGSLMEWYKNCTHADLLNLYSKSYGMNIEKLFQRLFQLRKKALSATLGEIV